MSEEHSGQVAVGDETTEHPRGALVLALLFLVALVAMWGYVFTEMVRSN